MYASTCANTLAHSQGVQSHATTGDLTGLTASGRALLPTAHSPVAKPAAATRSAKRGAHAREGGAKEELQPAAHSPTPAAHQHQHASVPTKMLLGDASMAGVVVEGEAHITPRAI